MLNCALFSNIWSDGLVHGICIFYILIKCEYYTLYGLERNFSNQQGNRRIRNSFHRSCIRSFNDFSLDLFYNCKRLGIITYQYNIAPDICIGWIFFISTHYKVFGFTFNDAAFETVSKDIKRVDMALPISSNSKVCFIWRFLETIHFFSSAIIMLRIYPVYIGL